MSTHALFAPSAAHRWMSCPGSIALSQTIVAAPAGRHASEGTAAHALAARCLTEHCAAASCLGEEIVVDYDRFVVDADMAGHVQRYIDLVEACGTGGELHVEQPVDVSSALGQPEAYGTPDAVAVVGDVLTIIDLKYGRGVRVDADANPQLMLYALGALSRYDPEQRVKSVRLVVHQPRLSHLSEWETAPAALHEFAAAASAAAKRAVAALGAVGTELHPGEEQCRWCPAKATCPGLRAEVARAIGAEFEQLDVLGTPPARPETLAQDLAVVPLIEDWCAAVRAEGFRRLSAGEPVEGHKLVAGRRGARAWADSAAAEAVLKAMRLKHDEMYDYSIISPTSAERLSKAGTIGPRQWPKLQDMIVQAAGKPMVVPVGDKRPAISVADHFEATHEPVAA